MCSLLKAKYAKQVIAPLPLCRLHSSLRTSTRTAVDFAESSLHNGRGAITCLAYFALFLKQAALPF